MRERHGAQELEGEAVRPKATGSSTSGACSSQELFDEDRSNCYWLLGDGEEEVRWET